MDELIQALKDLSPSVFENLVYDLLCLNGLRNGVWRTPGTDTGRDIEGDVSSVDFSGSYMTARWYVECKRYRSSVDWPTVWRKLAYADSQRADCLLIVTTAHLSPKCKSEVSRWNSDRRRPPVRVWDASSLESVIVRHPSILFKYGLPGTQAFASRSFLSLSRAALKLVQAAYGQAAIDEAVSPALECASAFAELLTVELQSFESGLPHRVSAFSFAVDGYEWLEVTGEESHIARVDKYALRAALSFIRHIYGLETLGIRVVGDVIEVPVQEELLASAEALLTKVAVLGDLELSVQDSVIAFRTRRPE